MNLLFIYASQILPHKGGVQRVTHDLCAYFKALGHNVYFLSSCKPETSAQTNSSQYYLTNNENIFSQENIKFYVDFVRDNRISIIINQGGTDPKLSRFCILIKKYIEVKVISVIHNSLLGNVLNYTSSHSRQIKRTHIPFLINLLQTELISKILLRAYIVKYKRHYTHTCNEYDKVVLLSSTFYSELIIFVPKCDSTKITSIANPCTLKPTGSTINKQNEILFVGRLNTTQKRVDLLLEIWSKLYKNFPDWNLSILGEGEERLKLENDSINLGLKRIKFYGIQNPIPFYERAKILCMTSSYEGLPLVLAEAQSFGTIPVAFKSFASVQDVINDGKNGLLIEPFKIEKYVARISELMGNNVEINLMADNCRKSANNFAIESVGKTWIDLFNLLLQKND